MPGKSDTAVTISRAVEDRSGHVRWVVVAKFVGVEGSEPRCVDYRVRVVPEVPKKRIAAGLGRRIARLMMDDANSDREGLWEAGESSAPAEGIPRRVFEEASQTRLLELARERANRGHVDPSVKDLLTSPAGRRRGRPPVMPLGQKLRILRDVETAFATGGTLQEVADLHHLSRGSIRNLLAWARSDAKPQLFEGTTVGRRGGRLTPAARALLKAQEN